MSFPNNFIIFYEWRRKKSLFHEGLINFPDHDENSTICLIPNCAMLYHRYFCTAGTISHFLELLEKLPPFFTFAPQEVDKTKYFYFMYVNKQTLSTAYLSISLFNIVKTGKIRNGLNSEVCFLLSINILEEVPLYSQVLVEHHHYHYYY